MACWWAMCGTSIITLSGDRRVGQRSSLRADPVENVQTQQELHVVTGHWEDPPRKKTEQDGHQQGIFALSFANVACLGERWLCK